MTGQNEVQGEQEPEHTHRWRIEAQGTATSAGTCACGAEKAFNNSWDGGKPTWSGSGRGGGRRPTRV